MRIHYTFTPADKEHLKSEFLFHSSLILILLDDISIILRRVLELEQLWIPSINFFIEVILSVQQLHPIFRAVVLDSETPVPRIQAGSTYWRAVAAIIILCDALQCQKEVITKQ